jgi:DNA-binding NarL/FixJ family response regulator
LKEAFQLDSARSATTVRALVVEDSRVSMRAISNLIALHPGVSIVGAAMDGEDGLRQARTLKPDIVFADLEMPGLNGLELVQQLRKEMPLARLVIISIHEGPVWVNLSKAHGADAFISKGELAEKLSPLFLEFFVLPASSLNTLPASAAAVLRKLN